MKIVANPSPEQLKWLLLVVLLVVGLSYEEILGLVWLLDYVFVDDDGNLIGGTYVRPNDPAGDRPIWVSLDDQSRQSDPVVWTNPYDAYPSTVMPLNRAPVFVSGLSARSPGGGHALERVRRSSKAATRSGGGGPRRSSPSSTGSSKCPDGSYWSWSKKRCVKSKFWLGGVTIFSEACPVASGRVCLFVTYRYNNKSLFREFRARWFEGGAGTIVPFGFGECRRMVSCWCLGVRTSPDSLVNTEVHH